MLVNVGQTVSVPKNMSFPQGRALLPPVLFDHVLYQGQLVLAVVRVDGQRLRITKEKSLLLGFEVLVEIRLLKGDLFLFLGALVPYPLVTRLNDRLQRLLFDALVLVVGISSRRLLQIGVRGHGNNRN